MSTAPDIGEIKALTRQLVKAAGGVEACAQELGLSPERISQWQRVSSPDIMPLLHIMHLEAVAERPVMTGAIARRIERTSSDCIHSAVVDAVQTATVALTRVHEMDDDRERDPHEIRQVQLAADQLRAASEKLHRTSMDLKPTRHLRAVGED